MDSAVAQQQVMGRDDARRLTDKIAHRLDAIADNYTAVMPLIRQAIDGRADVALGYRSIGEYVAANFGDSLSRLAPDMRRSVVGELAAAGLSTRAIAPVVGMSHATVANDLKEAPPVKDLTPGGRRAATFYSGGGFRGPGERIDTEVTAETVDLGTGEVGGGNASPEPTKRAITGLDGKTYQAHPPTPGKPRRTPLPDQARAAGWDLRKSVERLTRIAADDRFTANKTAVAPHLRGHLTYAIEVCQDLLDRINDEGNDTE